jgi:hypothetical protein
MAGEHGPNGHSQFPSTIDAIDRLSDELDDVEHAPIDGGVAYIRSGVVFAVREGPRLSFRLMPEVVAAALRTPDTSVCARGEDWVTLTPSATDPLVLDRAMAWFESAWRLVGGGSEGQRHIH